MTMKKQFYIRSVVKRLTTEIGVDDGHAIFLSPYLTSKTAETVIKSAPPSSAEIYTTFDIEIFASGGSSIHTLKRLSDEGYALYHLPNLHAKVVVTEKFASIGSQNLTTGGTRNLEASVAVTNQRAIEYIKKEIGEWLTYREEISREMIADVVELLPDAQVSYRTFQRELTKIETELTARQSERIAHKLRELEREEQRRAEEARLAKEGTQRKIRENSAPLRKAISSPNVLSSRQIYAQCIFAENRDEYGDIANKYSTLRRLDSDTSFIHWLIPSQKNGYDEVTFTKRFRYLMVLLENGKLAWPALQKTQLTQFGTGVSWDHARIFGQGPCKLTIDFAQTEDELKSWNVKFSISPNYEYARTSDLLSVFAYFTINDLRIVRVEPSSLREISSPTLKRIKQKINKSKTEAQHVLLNELLKPFKYQYNRNGVTAFSFFGGSTRVFKVRLHKQGDFKFLSATPI